MSDDSRQRRIHVGEAADGTALTLPVIEVLTGRGFATGKSGSGKSNTASVISEELLDAGYPLLIVDTDGEYYGLKEEYEMLHAGADEECDIQIGPEHAEQMATLALEENVPVILDVSGYLDEEVADELLKKIARQLFIKEKKLKKPFLLIVEEVHEYIPEGGGLGETGKLLIKISKRGRKHGLGILGISQRPADVKKDFITQANWLVWHRLTWDNDTKVVGRIIDTEYAERVAELNDGQAFVQTDWTEVDVRKVQFRRKRTFDAGATPGLDDFERPELKSVSDALVGDLETISERKNREENRIAELEDTLEQKERRIETLEAELESARDVSSAARQMADALSQSTEQTSLPIGGDDHRRLHEELAAVEAEREELTARCETLEAKLDELKSERDELADARTQLTAKLAGRVERVNELEAEVDDLEATIDRLRAENEELEAETEHLRAALDSAASSDEDGEIVEPVGPDHEFGYTTVDETTTERILVADDEAGETRSVVADETARSIEGETAESEAAEASESETAETGGAAGASESATAEADEAAEASESETAETGGAAGASESEIAETDGAATAVADESTQTAVAEPAATPWPGEDEASTGATAEESTAEESESTTDRTPWPGEPDTSDSVPESADGLDAPWPSETDDGTTVEMTESSAARSAEPDTEETVADSRAAAERPDTERTIEPNDEGEPEWHTDEAWLDDRIGRAVENSRCSARTARDVVSLLARSGPLGMDAVTADIGRSAVAAQSLLSELTTEGVLERPTGRRYTVTDRTREALQSE